MSVGWPFEDHNGLGQRSAPLPLLDDPGIARFGQGAWAKVRADKDAVRPAPGDPALGLGQLVTLFGERPGGEVKFA